LGKGIIKYGEPTEQEKLCGLYMLVDDFFQQLQAKRPKLAGDSRGRKKNLSLSELVTLGIFRHVVNIGTIKDYHRFLLAHYSEYFPIPNYQNFNHNLNSVMPYVLLFLQMLLNINKSKKSTIHFTDSTPLQVCKNQRISSHKVCKGLAERGKNSMGWFYGFKLHAICNALGQLEAIKITPGNIYDGHMVSGMAQGIIGQIVGDGGYLGIDLQREDSWLMAGVRKNMRKLMTPGQHALFRQRQTIETVFSVIKERLGIVTSIARSINGTFSRYVFCILAYFFIALRC